MASSLQEFESRAKEAENKLKSLESQINLFLGQLSSAKQQKDDEKYEWEMICYVINSLYIPLYSFFICSTTDWPLKNRGNFVKLVFEEANVPYKDRADFADIKSMMRSNKYGTQKLEDGGPYQAMVCPCHSLLQTAHCLNLPHTLTNI